MEKVFKRGGPVPAAAPGAEEEEDEAAEESAVGAAGNGIGTCVSAAGGDGNGSAPCACDGEMRKGEAVGAVLSSCSRSRDTRLQHDRSAEAEQTASECDELAGAQLSALVCGALHFAVLCCACG